MKPQDPTRREKLVCASKNPFPRKNKAMYHIRKARQRGRTARLRAYRCPVCNCWHLASIKRDTAA